MGKSGRKFPNRLRKHRRLAKFTQREVADLLNVSQSRVSAWENGEVFPSTINFLKLSILYHTLCNELYFDLLKEFKAEFARRDIND